MMKLTHHMLQSYSSISMNIRLSSFGTKFSNRPLARKIFGGVDSNINVNIDLKNVEEVTPSFFHEMLEILINEKKVTITISNLSEFLEFQLKKAESSFTKNN